MTTSIHPSTDLASILQSAGVELKRIGDREITGKCPVHIRTVGREDRSPSWSINANTGLWICFSCGARGTLSSLLAELMGTVDSISIQKFLINTRFDNLKTSDEETSVAQHLNPEKFFTFQRVSRLKCEYKNLDPDLVFTHGVRWNTENRSWCIPIISPMGQLMGWQEKKSDWVRNYPVGIKKADTLFGIERFKSRSAILVESPLDVVRLSAVFSRPQGLATFGAHVSKKQMSILVHVANSIVIAMDNDEAGIESSKKLYNLLPRPRGSLKWWNYKGTTAKDIGDMTDEEIEHGLMTATIVPPWIA